MCVCYLVSFQPKWERWGPGGQLRHWICCRKKDEARTQSSILPDLVQSDLSLSLPPAICSQKTDSMLLLAKMMSRKFPRVCMDTSMTFGCGHDWRRTQPCSWQCKMGQQFLTSIYCQLENFTDFLINKYFLSGFGIGTFVNSVVWSLPQSLAWSLGFPTLWLFCEAGKAERRAMTRN